MNIRGQYKMENKGRVIEGKLAVFWLAMFVASLIIPIITIGAIISKKGSSQAAAPINLKAERAAKFGFSDASKLKKFDDKTNGQVLLGSDSTKSLVVGDRITEFNDSAAKKGKNPDVKMSEGVAMNFLTTHDLKTANLTFADTYKFYKEGGMDLVEVKNPVEADLVAIEFVDKLSKAFVAKVYVTGAGSVQQVFYDSSAATQ